MMTCFVAVFVNVTGNPSSLAQAASSPVQATTSVGSVAAASTASAASAAAATSAASAPSAATASAGDLYAIPRSLAALLVKDIESRQADVGDFFLTESDFVTRCKIWRPRLIL
jgi:hypothetical protein